VGVRNLFERDPPFSAVAFTGFDPAYADPRGRTYYARLTCAFR
jgi:iron complex outermembrane receptor protein